MQRTFNLDWLERQEEIADNFLAGIAPPPASLIPKGCTENEALRILKSIKLLRRSIMDCLSIQTQMGFVSLSRLNDIVDAAMALSGHSTEAILLSHLGEKWLMGAEQAERLARSRKISSEKRNKKATADHAVWKSEAVEFWKANKNLSVDACSGKIIRKLRLVRSVKTVSDVIRRLCPGAKRNK